MRRAILALTLAAAPAVAHAQQIPPSIPPPAPLPGRDTMAVPEVALVLRTPDTPGEAVLVGVVEGAAFGAAYGAVLAQQRPECAPSESATASAATGAVAGGVWGGLRALLGGRRHARIRTVAANDRIPPAIAPRPNPERGPLPPIGDSRCLAGLRGPVVAGSR